MIKCVCYYKRPVEKLFQRTIRYYAHTHRHTHREVARAVVYGVAMS